MDLQCIGFYIIKETKKASNKENKFIKCRLNLSANIDKLNLDIVQIDEEDIYDDDEEERVFKKPKTIKLSDYKQCVKIGKQKHNDLYLYVLLLTPKMFSKAKKICLGFLSDETYQNWLHQIDTYITGKSNTMKPLGVQNESQSISSSDQFMIENDVYEGSLESGEFYGTIVENEKSKEIGLMGTYILVITEFGLDLKKESTEMIVKSWDIKHLRRFGEKDNLFLLELGKFCDGGPGSLTFSVTKGKYIIRDLVSVKENAIKHRHFRKSVVPRQLSEEDNNDNSLTESQTENHKSSCVISTTLNRTVIPESEHESNEFNSDAVSLDCSEMQTNKIRTFSESKSDSFEIEKGTRCISIHNTSDYNLAPTKPSRVIDIKKRKLFFERPTVTPPDPPCLPTTASSKPIIVEHKNET